jgi:hypothetical protein
MPSRSSNVAFDGLAGCRAAGSDLICMCARQPLIRSFNAFPDGSPGTSWWLHSCFDNRSVIFPTSATVFSG